MPIIKEIPPCALFKMFFTCLLIQLWATNQRDQPRGPYRFAAVLIFPMEIYYSGKILHGNFFCTHSPLCIVFSTNVEVVHLCREFCMEKM